MDLTEPSFFSHFTRPPVRPGAPPGGELRDAAAAGGGCPIRGLLESVRPCSAGEGLSGGCPHDGVHAARLFFEEELKIEKVTFRKQKTTAAEAHHGIAAAPP